MMNRIVYDDIGWLYAEVYLYMFGIWLAVC